MFYTEINKAVLQKYYPGLYEELLIKDDDDFSSDDIKIEAAQAGGPTLNIKGLYIHSPRDPAREAERLVKSVCGGIPDSQNSPILILGFGLGYAAQAAAACGRLIIIVEKHKSLFLKALELRDFSGLFSGTRFIFVIGGSGEGITNALSIAYKIIQDDAALNDTAGSGKKPPPSVIRSKALISLDEQWYGQADDRVRSWSMKDDVNDATHKRFGKRWMRNLSRNMSAIRDLPGVSYLAGIAEKKGKNFSVDHADGNECGVNECNDCIPVFLAAAGPSLDKIKPLLCDIYERCIVVAVDTSLRFFVKNGIAPDFVVVVDPQFWNSRHLDRCLSEEVIHKTALIAESAVYPPVLNLPFKHKYLCGSLFPLGTFIENRADQKGRLAAGGSVATTAWDFARLLGGEDIWIAGLDLSFPDLKTHFRGARFEDTASSQSNKFNPAEKWVVRALRDGKPFNALSANGGQVLTDQRLSLYKAWFENQFRRNVQIKNRGFFLDGLAIAGFNSADTEEFLTLPKRRGEIDRIISEAYSETENKFNNPREKHERQERYEKAVSLLEQGLKIIKAAAEEGSEIAWRALRYPLNPQQRNNALKELDKITKRLDESEVKEIAGFLFPPVDEEENSSGDPFRAYLKSTQKLFSGIKEAADFYIMQK